MCDTFSRRRDDLKRFYGILRRIKQTNGEHRLTNYDTKKLPEEPGVYFFKESQEFRTDTARSRRRRVVRVGTSNNLRKRLRSHKNKSGSSAFRDVVRIALTQRDGLRWNDLDEDGKEVYRRLTSQEIHSMPFLWLEAYDTDNRSYIESNSTMILSNYRRCQRQQLDRPSHMWLGRCSPDERIAHSGLWSRDDVNGRYNHDFISILDELVT